MGQMAFHASLVRLAPRADCCEHACVELRACVTSSLSASYDSMRGHSGRPVISESAGKVKLGDVFTEYGEPVLNPENKSVRRVWNENDMLVVFAD